MGTGRGKKEETKLQQQAQTAYNEMKPTPGQEYADAHNLALMKGLDSGKDVRDISELNPYLNLYDASVANNQDYAGEGLLGNNALAGSNGQLAGLIGQQMASRRQQDAEGQLYNTVNAARASAEGNTLAWSQLANQQTQAKADIANQRYLGYLQRPKQPGLLSSIIQGGMTAAAALI